MAQGYLQSHWFNVSEYPPTIKVQFVVKDTIDGPEYKARYNGPGYAWTIISFANGATPIGNPKYWRG